MVAPAIRMLQDHSIFQLKREALFKRGEVDLCKRGRITSDLALAVSSYKFPEFRSWLCRLKRTHDPALLQSDA
jgi:hypothetical protein